MAVPAALKSTPTLFIYLKKAELLLKMEEPPNAPP